jgi:hypothetical protein
MTVHFFVQTHGKLADAAEKIRVACLAGDFTTCQRIWKEITGQDTLEHNLTNYTFWMFVATTQIKEASRPSADGTWEHACEY